MALKAEIPSEYSNSFSMKIEGDIGDLQVIEEHSDSENDTSQKQNDSRSISTLSNLPGDLIHTSSVPVFGAVNVRNSENVQFGNNTYFNGPVTIKQIVNPKMGVENPSYTNTEVDDNQPNRPTFKFGGNPIQKIHIKPWHKLALTAVFVVVIGSICAYVLLRQTKSNNDSNNSPNSNGEDSSTSDPLLIAPDHLRIVSRVDWLAQKAEHELEKLKLPAPWVIITHTATEGCAIQSACVLSVRLIQTFHIESKKWDDIGYNFLVGGDGSAYMGRGWDFVGAHTKGYNRYSIGIAFIGTFNSEYPPKQQVEACKRLIKFGVDQGKIAKDYKLFAHRQLMSTLSPGDVVFNIIKEWPHFVSNVTDLDDLIPK